MATCSLELSSALGQHDVLPSPPIIPRDMIMGVVGLTTAATVISVPDAFTGLFQLCLVLWSYVFFFRGEAFIDFLMLSLTVSVLCFHIPIWMSYSSMGTLLLGFAQPKTFRAYPWQAYVPPGNGLWPMSGVPWRAAPSTALSRGVASFYSVSCHPSNQCGGIYSCRGLAESHPSPPPSQCGREGSFILGFVPSILWLLKLVIGHYIAEFSHNWQAVFCCLITHLPWLHRQGVNTIETHLKQGVMIALFGTKQLQTLSMVFIPYSLTLSVP